MHIMFKIIALIMMFLFIPVVHAAAEVDSTKVDESASAESAMLPPAYPQWPEQDAYVSAVPAPPLGPYMSTGLSGTSRRFACCENRQGNPVNSPSFENMPWPEARRPPQQWLPEQGQNNYVPRDASGFSDTGQANRYGNQSRPQQQRMWQEMYPQPRQPYR